MSRTRAVIKFLFPQGKAPKKIHTILTKALACFLPGRGFRPLISTPVLWHFTTTTHITKQLTWSTVRSPYDAKGSTPESNPHISSKPTVRYRVHNSQPLVPTLNQINPVHTYPSETVCNKQTSCLFAVRTRSKPLEKPQAQCQTSSAACK